MNRAKRIAVHGWRKALSIATFGYFPFAEFVNAPIVDLTTAARNFDLHSERNMNLTAQLRSYDLLTEGRNMTLSATRNFNLTYRRQP